MAPAEIIFVTGGVRSGKSTFAEHLAKAKALEIGGKLHYIAAGMPTDEEMKERIQKHQWDRRKSGYRWQTWEQPTNIATLAPFFTEKDVILLDCLTTLLTNELFSAKENADEKELYNRILTGIGEIAKSSHQLVIVSNEVLLDFFPDSALVRKYCRLIGKLHQKIVSISAQAYAVEAGIPLLKKGAAS